MLAWGALAANLIEYFQSRMVIYALVVAMFGLGSVAGAIAVRSVNESTSAELSAFLDEYVTAATAQTGSPSPARPHEAALAAAGRGAALPWLLGLSVIGAPGILALVFLRGFALGFTAAYLIYDFSYKGILLAILSLVPHSILAVPGAVLAAGAALTFTVGAVKIGMGKRDEGSVLTHALASGILAAFAGLLLAASAWVQESVTPVLLEVVARRVPF